jgi:predicted enzyme involved in methoxymalonyl-ACP biosynthesis
MVFIDPDNPLAAEILQESGEAYFAACRKMVDSLEALREFERDVASADLDEEQIARRSELLDHAAERVHFVLIQRDAMKLSWSETFFEHYEVPEEVTKRLRPR